MPQIHCSIPPEVEEELRVRAKARRMPLSKYVAEILTKEVRSGWPEGWFERVIGAWKDPIERPPQGRSERRRPL